MRRERKSSAHQIPYQVHFIDGTHAEQDTSDWSDTIVEISRAAARIL